MAEVEIQNEPTFERKGSTKVVEYMREHAATLDILALSSEKKIPATSIVLNKNDYNTN